MVRVVCVVEFMDVLLITYQILSSINRKSDRWHCPSKKCDRLSKIFLWNCAHHLPGMDVKAGRRVTHNSSHDFQKWQQRACLGIKGSFIDSYFRGNIQKSAMLCSQNVTRWLGPLGTLLLSEWFFARTFWFSIEWYFRNAIYAIFFNTLIEQKIFTGGQHVCKVGTLV